MTSSTLRTMVEKTSFVTCPGVFDLVSAKLADRTRADALYDRLWSGGVLSRTA